MFLNPESSWPYLVTLQPCRVNILNCCQHLTGKKNCFFHKHVFVYYWTCPSRTCSNHCPDPDPVLSFLHPSFGEIHSLVFGITQINNKINPSLNETFQTVWILWLLPVWLETDFTHKNTTRWLKCCADNIFFFLRQQTTTTTTWVLSFKHLWSRLLFCATQDIHSHRLTHNAHLLVSFILKWIKGK